MQTPEQILQHYFSHSSFRESQKLLIDALLEGRDVLGVMPTGAGKSICYQVPAMLASGITLVISPLVSLMKDQVTALLHKGIPAAYLSHSLPEREQRKVFSLAYHGKLRFLYLSPERLHSPGTIALLQTIPISYLAVDEAHCISQWGQDFRPSYAKIPEFLRQLPQRPPVGAFTATATKRVREDIIQLLELRSPLVSVSGFDRSNLTFITEQPRDRLEHLITLLLERHDKNGIVYCSTRRTVDELFQILSGRGFSVCRYHAGMDDTDRQKQQEQFLQNKAQIMLATNAFGMGINKSNVSFVIHYNLPQSMESYYQEAGRAGRDGNPADCILLYHPQDVRICEFLIQNSYEQNNELDAPTRALLRERDHKRLNTMIQYATTNQCLRHFILDYFGEESPNSCMNCSSCMTRYISVDVTMDAQKIISCVFCLAQRGRHMGKTTLSEILLGVSSERVLQNDFQTLPAFGMMKHSSAKIISFLVDDLTSKGYLLCKQKPYPVYQLCPKSAELAQPDAQFYLYIPRDNSSGNYEIRYTARYEKLRAFRATICAREQCFPDAVFSCDAMEELCVHLPTTLEELEQIPSLSQKQIELFGEELLAFLAPYTNPPTPENAPEQTSALDDPKQIRPWSAEEQTLLYELSHKRCPVSQIADTLHRPMGMVLAKLKSMHLPIVR